VRRLARAGCSLPLHLLVPAVMKSPRLWGFVILLAAFVCFAQEQENNNPLKGLSLEQLGDVKITTVSKVPEEVWKTPAAIYVITQEDIRRSGATNIPDALRLAPGVEVGRIDSDTWAIGIRGEQNNFSKAVLVLIDGRSVYSPLLAGVFWDAQDVVLEDIDRIEVIRGPGATVWGPNAADGVINIVTKKASETHGGLASGLSGNQDRFIGETRYGGGNGKGFDYRIYAKGFDREPEFHLDHDDFDRWHQERGGFRMDWSEPHGDEYTLQGDVYGGIFPHEVGSTTFIDNVSGGNILGRWTSKFSDGSDVYLQAYFDRTVRAGADIAETRNTFDVDFEHHLKIGTRNDFIYGGGIRLSPNHIVQEQVSENVVPNIETDYIYSGFLQDQIHFFRDRLLVTVGSKFLDNNFSGFDVEPTGRLLWNPNPRQSFWTSVTRAVTTPSRLEEGLQLTGEASANPPIFLLVSGNPHFKSESLVGYEGGYRQLLTPKFFISLSVFHNRYSNLQSFGAPTLAGNTITILYENAIAGSNTGIEVAPTWTPRQWWKLAGSYSFVGVEAHATGGSSNISSTGSVSTYEGSSPAHQMQLQSNFNLGKRFEFDQGYRFVSALPAQNVNAYQTMDARIACDFTKNWNLSLVGQNLFQRYHYEWGTGDPTQQLIGIKRAAYLKLTWTP